MAVHTISILFPSYSSDFIHLSLNFLSYKIVQNLSDNHNVIVFSMFEILWEKKKKNEKGTIHFKPNRMD